MLFHMPTRKLNSPQLKIDNIPIKQIDTFNFLGITLQKDLKWETHINKIACKISKILGIMNNLKHYVPSHILRTIYSSLILPHINYGILLWGNNTQRIFKLQKRAVRIITLSKYISHTEPLFKNLNLLKIEDIHTLNLYKFIYKLRNNTLPTYFKSITLTPFCDIHQHNTRNKHYLLTPKIKHEFAKRSIRYVIPNLINASPSEIIDKIQTHCPSGFAFYIKRFFITNYENLCSVSNCYVCQRN